MYPGVPVRFSQGNCNSISVGLCSQRRTREQRRAAWLLTAVPKWHSTRVPNTDCGPVDGSGIYILHAMLLLIREGMHLVMLPQHTASLLFFPFPYFVHPYCCFFLSGKRDFVSCIFKVPLLLLLFSQRALLPAPLIVTSRERGKTPLPNISHRAFQRLCSQASSV